MLFSISWMVTRDPQADGERMISVLLGWFLAGGLVGGALMGAVVAIPAWALSRAFGAHISAFVVATAVVAVVYLGKAANLWPAPKPQFRHQVPEAWRNLFIPSIAAFIYSAGLGALFFTRLASLAVYPFAIMLIGIGGNPIGVIALLAATGLVRGATAITIPVVGFHRTSADAVPRWMGRHNGKVRNTEILVLLCVALIAASQILTYRIW